MLQALMDDDDESMLVHVLTALLLCDDHLDATHGYYL